VRFGLDGDFTGIGELDGVADKIDQNLRQAAAISRIMAHSR
jgi:signal transduction histidine kinase